MTFGNDAFSFWVHDSTSVDRGEGVDWAWFALRSARMGVEYRAGVYLGGAPDRERIVERMGPLRDTVVGGCRAKYGRRAEGDSTEWDVVVDLGRDDGRYAHWHVIETGHEKRVGGELDTMVGSMAQVRHYLFSRRETVR